MRPHGLLLSAVLPLVAGAQVTLAPPDWVELHLRGDRAEVAQTPWQAGPGALSFSATGRGAYDEDAIATSESYVVDGSRLEFDLQVLASTREGYVGPSFLWIDEPLRKRSAYLLDGAGPAYLGAGVFYGWENQGRGGALLFSGAPAPAWHERDRPVPGVNDGRFAHHVLSVGDGHVSWEIDGAPFARAKLAQPLAKGERRRLLVSTRLYDRGLVQRVELRNLRLTVASSSAAPEARPKDTFVEASGPGEQLPTRLALAFVGPTVVIEGAGSLGDIARDFDHWRLAIKGNTPGTFPAAVTWSEEPGRGWLSTVQCTATLTRVEGPGGLVEGRFECALLGPPPGEGQRRERAQVSGTFRAEVQR